MEQSVRHFSHIYHYIIFASEMQSRISKVPVDTMVGAMCITKAQKIQTIYSKKTNKRNMKNK